MPINANTNYLPKALQKNIKPKALVKKDLKSVQADTNESAKTNQGGIPATTYEAKIPVLAANKPLKGVTDAHKEDKAEIHVP